MKNTKTYSLKARDIANDWQMLDAQDQVLGRLAARAAHLLMGKHKPTYTPHLPMGDYVIVVNAARVKVTGNKLADKVYYRHSGYMGGLKETTLQVMLERRPERVVELAVKRMLPQNKLGQALLRRLKVYAGPEHPHEAQVKAAVANVSGEAAE
ncbi:MAG TPA: 50S ribosomal protein L13 [Dehalococcoidia bacterium]|nr:50S ribosomal protein L13 [Dehalococcoidia bacterium]